MKLATFSAVSRLLGFLAVFGMTLAACDHVPAGEELPVMPELEKVELSPSEDTEITDAVSDLPHAKGMTFTTLDAYLAHLERYSVQDMPYYRRLKTGDYEHEVGRQPLGMTPTQRIYTREELEQKFGFTAKDEPTSEEK